MPFVFIGGCGRSGTSLVQKVLISHSRVAGGNEFDHTSEIVRLYERMSREFFLRRQSEFYSKDELTETFRSFFKSLFAKMQASKPGATFLSEKTPRNIEVAKTLLALFPESVFVNVVRDGRDVLASHLDVADRSAAKNRERERGLEVRPVCALWNLAIHRAAEIENAPECSERFHTVRYESLVTRPEQEIGSLCRFLKIQVEAQMLSPERISEKDAGFLVDDVWYTGDMYRQAINPKRIGRWKERLSLPTRMIANTLMAANLLRQGYEVDPGYIKAAELLARFRTSTS